MYKILFVESIKREQEIIVSGPLETINILFNLIIF